MTVASLPGADQSGSPLSRWPMRILLTATLTAGCLALGCSGTDEATEPDAAPDVAPDLVADVADEPDMIEDSAPDVDVGEELPPTPDVVPDLADEPDTLPDADALDVADDEVIVVEPNFNVAPCAFVFADTNGRGFDQPIQLVNNAVAPAEIRAIEVPETAAARFSFIAPEMPFELGAGESVEVTMHYESGFPGDRTLDWVLHYAHGDVGHQVACTARADGPADSCPIVDLELSVVGDPLERRGPVVGWAAPLDTIRLEAIETGGDPVEESLWRFNNGPPRAARTLTEDPEDPENPLLRHYRLSTPGSFSLCLEVAGESGEFCEQCTDVAAEAPDGIWAELFWDVELGNADLDFHGVRMNGDWFDEEVDVWGGNPGAAWSGDGSGLLATDEFRGPETIAIHEECRWYALGAHHVSGDAPAVPFLRVYSGGAFLTELTGPVLEPGDFWDAGRAHRGGGRVLVVNTHLEDVTPGEFAPAVTDAMVRSGLCDTE